LLVRRGMVLPSFNKFGYLKALLLLVPTLVARRAVRNGLRPSIPSSIITQPKTLSLRWRPHYDKARPAFGVR